MTLRETQFPSMFVLCCVHEVSAQMDITLFGKMLKRLDLGFVNELCQSIPDINQQQKLWQVLNQEHLCAGNSALIQCCNSMDNLIL
jgi:hypothetical protein